MFYPAEENNQISIKEDIYRAMIVDQGNNCFTSLF